MNVAEFRAQQQALVQQEQQKRRLLHQQLQQAAQQLQQSQQQLEEMQQLREEVAALKQQHQAEQQQLSERLMESVNQKQVTCCVLQRCMSASSLLSDDPPATCSHQPLVAMCSSTLPSCG